MSDIAEKLRERLTAHIDTQREQIDKLIRENVALTARVEELEAAHKAIMELPGEINTGNYTHDDVVALNNAFCEAFHISSAALTKGESNG